MAVIVASFVSEFEEFVAMAVAVLLLSHRNFLLNSLPLLAVASEAGVFLAVAVTLAEQ